MYSLRNQLKLHHNITAACCARRPASLVCVAAGQQLCRSSFQFCLSPLQRSRGRADPPGIQTPCSAHADVQHVEVQAGATSLEAGGASWQLRFVFVVRIPVQLLAKGESNSCRCLVEVLQTRFLHIHRMDSKRPNSSPNTKTTTKLKKKQTFNPSKTEMMMNNENDSRVAVCWTRRSSGIDACIHLEQSWGLSVALHKCHRCV